MHLIRRQRNPKQKQPLDSFPRVLATHTNCQYLAAHHCLEIKTSLFHFSSFKRPNMLTLDRFQSCFNLLKSVTKSAFTSLTAGRFYVFLPLLPSIQRFHSTQSPILGEMQVWGPSKPSGNNGMGTRR